MIKRMIAENKRSFVESEIFIVKKILFLFEIVFVILKYMLKWCCKLGEIIMSNANRFFHDFYDGQIVKEESDRYKLFKIMLVSVVSAFAIFMYLAKLCNLAELVIVEVGMIWNFYTKLNNKMGVVMCVFVSMIYFVISCNFYVYSNALIYIAFYIPFQLFASTKEYNLGDFVQVRKKMSDWVQVVYVLLALSLSIIFYMFNLAVGSRFATLDALSAGCLVASALLRNERYSDYYTFRFLALLFSIALWVAVATEYVDPGVLLLVAMYLAYLIYDLVNFIVQKSTYENQYMRAVERYQQIENEKVINAKLEAYEQSKTN